MRFVKLEIKSIILIIVSAMSLLSFQHAAALSDSGNAVETYIGSIKQKLVRDWHPSQPRLLSVTKLKVVLDSTGAIVKRELLAAGWSQKEKRSIDECLKSVSFGRLPSELGSLELNVSFVSGEAIKEIDISDASNPNLPVITSAITTSNFGPYLRDLQRRIKRTWHPPKDSQFRGGACVQFTVLHNGAITNLKLYRTSGDEGFDQAALKSIENAAPFASLSANDKIDIQFTFGDWLLAENDLRPKHDPTNRRRANPYFDNGKYSPTKDDLEMYYVGDFGTGRRFRPSVAE
jgi:TonB family protein